LRRREVRPGGWASWRGTKLIRRRKAPWLRRKGVLRSLEATGLGRKATLGWREWLCARAWLPWRLAKTAWRGLADATPKRLGRWLAQAKTAWRTSRLGLSLPGRVGGEFKTQFHATRTAQRNGISSVERLRLAAAQLHTINRRAIRAANIDHLIAPATQWLYFRVFARYLAIG
jgi:hypothetical protein